MFDFNPLQFQFMKHTLLFLFIGLLSMGAQAEKIQLAHDLSQDGKIALTENKPIVFFVTADHCPYCEQLRAEYFQFSPSDERFLLREIELDEYHDLIGFDGGISNHQLIADRFDISLTPTVAFVGPDGTALAKPIIGVLTMDYYHYYFEKALNEAIIALTASNNKRLTAN